MVCEELCAEAVPARLLSGLFTQRRTGKFCDVKLHVGGTWLWAHSSVLSVFSATLHNAFISERKGKNYNDWSLNEPLQIILADLAESDGEELECVECADKVVDFVYSGRIGLEGLEHVRHVEALARVLRAPELPDLCLEARLKLQPEEAHPAAPDAAQACEASKVVRGHSYACLGCSSKHRTAASLLQHLRHPDHDNANLNCSLCLRYRAKNPTDLSEHLALHEHRLPFFCGECEARFRTRTALSAHLPKHSMATPFVCAECGRGFKWKHALISHALVHSDEKRHLCDTCGYSTAHYSSFRAHKMVHAGVSWRCPEPGCRFVATRKQSLTHHIPTHNNQRHYQCEVCGQSFSMYKNLRRHAAKHEVSPAGLMCCPVPGCLYSNTRLDKIKAHAERHKSGKPVRTSLVPRVRQTTPREPAHGATEAKKSEPADADQNFVFVIPMEVAPIVERLQDTEDADGVINN